MTPNSSGFTNADPRALDMLSRVDDETRQAVESARALLCSEFEGAEVDLEFSCDGSSEEDYLLAVVAYTDAPERLRRVRSTSRRWAETCGNHKRVVLNAHYSEVAV